MKRAQILHLCFLDSQMETKYVFLIHLKNATVLSAVHLWVGSSEERASLWEQLHHASRWSQGNTKVYYSSFCRLSLCLSFFYLVVCGFFQKCEGAWFCQKLKKEIGVGLLCTSRLCSIFFIVLNKYYLHCWSPSWYLANKSPKGWLP